MSGPSSAHARRVTDWDQSWCWSLSTIQETCCWCTIINALCIWKCLICCRFAELRQSLELYGLDPRIKLKPARTGLESSRFESSNFRVLVDEVKNKHMEGQKMSSWLILRAVEELIKIHAPEKWAKSFLTELVQAKKHKGENVGIIAQYLCE